MAEVRAGLNVPESMIRKLNEFAKKDLSRQEVDILNAVFNVYSYTMEHRCAIFKNEPAFLKEINQYESEEVEAAYAVTPTIFTLTTITTILSSHPLIGCSRAVRDCNATSEASISAKA